MSTRSFRKKRKAELCLKNDDIQKDTTASIENTRFFHLIETIFEDASGSEDSSIYIIPIEDLKELKIEVFKLKSQNLMKNLPLDSLTKFINLLGNSIRCCEGIALIIETKDNAKELNLLISLTLEKINVAVEASIIIMYIYTSGQMDQTIYNEEIIELIINFAYYQIKNTFSNLHNLGLDGSKKKLNDYLKNINKKYLKNFNALFSELTLQISEFITIKKLSEVLQNRVCSLALSLLQTPNEEFKCNSVKLLVPIFSRYEKTRKFILDEILSSESFTSHSYILDSGESVQTFTLLIVQLIQSLSDISETAKKADFLSFLSISFNTTKTLVIYFLNNLVVKVTNGKTVHCYQELFNEFTSDLLRFLKEPKWPASTYILMLMCTQVVNSFLKNSNDIPLQKLCVDFLTKILIYIWKDVGNDMNAIFEQGLKKNPTDEDFDTHISNLQKILDHLLSYDYKYLQPVHAQNFLTLHFYQTCQDKLSKLQSKDGVTEFKETLHKINQFVTNNFPTFSEKNQCKAVINQEIQKMYKDFLSNCLGLFENPIIFLNCLLRGIGTNPLPIRLKCLNGLKILLDLDIKLANYKAFQIAVKNTLLDQSPQMRESAVDMFGKIILQSSELIENNYMLIMERTLDTCVSVRKKAIKVLTDVLLKHYNLKIIPEICYKIAKRIKDNEESVQKEVLESFKNTWFAPLGDTDTLVKKIKIMVESVALSCKENSDCFELLLSALYKEQKAPEDFIPAQQIVDCLVELVIQLDKANCDNEKLLTCTRLLHIFASYCPQLMIPHFYSIHSFLNLRHDNRNNEKIIRNILEILHDIIPLLENPNRNELENLESDLMKLITQCDAPIIIQAVPCLSLVLNISKNYQLIAKTLKIVLNYINKINPQEALTNEEKPRLLRTLCITGILVECFDIKDSKIFNEIPSENIEYFLVTTLLKLIAVDNEAELFVLKAIGRIATRFSHILLEKNMKLYFHETLLSIDTHSMIKIQMLKNFEYFLTTEDKRICKQEKLWQESSKKESLKDLGNKTNEMAGLIIQEYVNSILICSTDGEQRVRVRALNVLNLVLQQGLIHPLRLVPHLMASHTDENYFIRNVSIKHLEEIEKKYPGYSHMKSLEGFNLSFAFQKRLKKGEVVRGYEKTKDGFYGLTGFIYSLMKNKQQKRSFVLSLIRQFDGDKKNSLDYMLYVADNIAYFPYKIIEEVLYIIYQIDVVLSITGANMVQMFEENLLPKKELAENVEENLDEEESEKELLERLPEDLTPLKESIKSSPKIIILGHLKKHLKDMYNINFGKISEFSPSSKAKTFEKVVKQKKDTNCPFYPEDLLNKFLHAKELGGPALIRSFLEVKKIINVMDTDSVKENNPPTPGDSSFDGSQRNADRKISLITNNSLILEDLKEQIKQSPKERKRKLSQSSMKEKPKKRYTEESTFQCRDLDTNETSKIESCMSNVEDPNDSLINTTNKKPSTKSSKKNKRRKAAKQKLKYCSE